MFRRGMLGDMIRHPLASAIVLTIIAIISFVVNISGVSPICGGVFLIYALIFWVIWLVRFTRDQKTVAEAQARMQQQAAPPLNTPGTTPTQATPPYMMQPPTQRAKRSGRVYLPGQQGNDPQ